MKRRFALALAALLLAAAQASASPKPFAMTVDPQWLDSHLSDPCLVILHLGKKEEYDQRHIPGARFVRLSDIAVDRDEQTLQMPDSADLKRRLGALGIGNDSHVVVYFGKDWVSPATRVIYTLYAAGLGERVALLDGGLDEWTRLGKPVTARPPQAAASPGPDLALRPAVVDADFVRAHVRKAGYVLADARARVYYDGIEPSGDMRKLRKGHIPGAVSLPFTDVVGLDNKLKPRAELEAMFRAAGITPASHLIVYCHIGQQATAVLFAARMLGIDAVLYDGSFEDWTWRDGPVEARANQ
ncbi:MAG TPA: rhodanese-like domain-containing protein [Telluria sp.]|nr:rhodanese-like domain-containing protein [Telluria sp.]